MKIFKVVLFSSTLALDCYTCDEYGYASCDQNKVLTACEPDQTSCFIEEHQIHGNMARISIIKLFLNSHTDGMAVAQPLGFEIDFWRNPISGSAA